MNTNQTISALNLIKSDYEQQKAEAEHKNRIRKCDIHLRRISLCQQKIDAIDYVLHIMEMLEDDGR